MIAPDKIPNVLQQSSSDCGVACLASVIQFHEGEQSIEHLRYLSGTTVQGTTVLGLVEAGRKIGMEGDAYRIVDLSHLDSLTSPAILHVVIDQKFSHFVVCYGKANESYHLMDPAVGPRLVSQAELLEIWQSKSLILLKPGCRFQTAKDTYQKKKKWFINLIRPDLPILLISGFLGLIVTILGLSVAVFSQKLIDELLPDQSWERLSLGLVLLSVLLIGRSVLTFLRSSVLIRQSKEFNFQLISSFFTQLLSLPKTFFDSRKVGDITSRMNDSRRIQRAVSVLTTELMVDTFVVLVTLIAILIYSWQIGCLVAGFLPIYFLVVYRYHFPIRKGQEEVMLSYSGSESAFIDTLTGIGAIKAESKEDLFFNKNEGAYGSFQDKVFSLGLVSNQLSLVSQLSGVVFLVSVLASSCYFVAQSKMELGVLVAISGMVGMLVPAVNKLALANLQIQEAKIAFNRLYEFIQIEKEVGTKGSLIPEKVESVSFHGVNFRFPGRKPLLHDLNFQLNCGKLSVLLGESGGGKSTLLQLLMGFDSPAEGSILINQVQPLENTSMDSWRGNVGYVPQDIKIFNGSLISNLTLNEDPGSFKHALDRCKELGVDEFFERLPQGYLSQVGEEGINLSGGQKQLVGLIRTLLKKPKLLLLDEFTGAMDRITEQEILNLIMRIKTDIPVLIVTHRIRPALIADEVMILEGGGLKDRGAPLELLEKENLLSKSLKDLVG